MKNQNGGISRGLIIGLAPVVVLVAAGLYFYGYLNGLRTESVNRENQLNAQYVSNQNFLSTYISGFYEQLGVANLKSEKMDKILTDAVKGRYEGSGVAKGAMFSAMVEAYPDLQGLNIFDKMTDYIAANREGYRNIQDKLLDMLRQFNTWRQDGMVQSWVVASLLGIPSQRLEARIGTDVVRGQSALDRMWVIVLTEKATNAYLTGKMDPLQVPKQ